MVHYDDGAESRAQCCQVPGVVPDRRLEPRGAKPEQQAGTAEQVGDESRRRVVALEFGEGPAFGQRRVDERQRRQGLATDHTDRQQAQQTVPRGEVGFTIQVFVVKDGSQAQNCTEAAEALQGPVNAAFRLVWKSFDDGSMRREDEDGFCHEEAKLRGNRRKINCFMIPIILENVSFSV